MIGMAQLIRGPQATIANHVAVFHSRQPEVAQRISSEFRQTAEEGQGAGSWRYAMSGTETSHN
jgi:hypothetical protein